MASPRDNCVLIIGAGGHGAVVVDILRAAGHYRPAGFIDADPSLVGQTVAGIPVLGAFNQISKLRPQFSQAIVAIGDNRVRRSYEAKLTAAGFELINALHPSAVISPTAELGKNLVIAAGAIVGTSAKIANSVLLNTGCIIDHECVIEHAAHIGPGAKLAGRVRVGPAAFVGIGAAIIPCMRIGEEATVGAGAVVIRDVQDRETVVGVPAKPIARPIFS
jgi:sugar O-acyltransferase (sialic acid O-acetyltransferase NeuD family)